MATPRPGRMTGLVIGTLVTWRVSHLLVAEDGPGQLLTRLRAAVDATPLAGLLDCFGCTSVWVGALAGLAVNSSGAGRGGYFHGGRAGALNIVLDSLAMSGAAFLLQKAITSREAADWLPEPEVDSPLITVLE